MSASFTVQGAVGICFHPAVRGAEEVATRLAALVAARGGTAWTCALPSADDGVAGGELRAQVADAALLVCVGGDGTVLQASGVAALSGTPVFGVRMGRLGFLTETTGEDAEDALRRVLDGEARTESLAMVQAVCGDAEPVHALNDIVIGRATVGRTISVGVRIDGVLLAEYRADALVIATATGSTGYALSAGGPILFPTSDDVVMVPVAPHLTRANPLVLPGSARLLLSIERGYEAAVTADGHLTREVSSGSVVEVTRSPRSARFVRLGTEHEFYRHLADRLGWLRADHVIMESNLDG